MLYFSYWRLIILMPLIASVSWGKTGLHSLWKNDATPLSGVPSLPNSHGHCIPVTSLELRKGALQLSICIHKLAKKIQQPLPPPPSSKMGYLMGRLCSPSYQTRPKTSTRGMGQCKGRLGLGHRWAEGWALPPLRPCTFHCPSPLSHLKSSCCS